MKPLNIGIIGAGKVATHLCKALVAHGHQISVVYSRTEASAKQLAEPLNLPWVTDIQAVPDGADLYILALNENGLSELDFPHWGDAVVVHTSGGTPMRALQHRSKNFGVFYPLQTFSLQRAVDFRQVPICIEGSNEEVLNLLQNLGKQLSDRVEVVDSAARKQLHLAAVFVNNFANHLFVIAESISREADVPFDLLRPLLRETADKALSMSPLAAQTGPAVRNNRNIIDAHLKLLEDDPLRQNIYNFVSQSIFEAHRNDG